MKSNSIPSITAETICSCIEAVNKFEGDINYLTNYINRSENYVRRAIKMGVNLNIFSCEKDKIYLNKSSSSIMKRVNNDAKIVFREALYNYKPFIQFIDFIANKNDLEESVRKIKAIFSICTDEKTILFTFKNFSNFLDIKLKPESINNIFNKEKKYNKINKIISTIDDKFQAQLLISDKLGSECYNFLSNPERSLLSLSILKSTSDPRNAVDDAAGAFESFLRRIGKEKQIDLTNQNGIGQISQFLSSKKNKVILAEHRIMSEFIGAFRNPSTHKVHKFSLEHWEINSDTSIEIVLLILTSIRSIYHYVFSKQFVL